MAQTVTSLISLPKLPLPLLNFKLFSLFIEIYTYNWEIEFEHVKCGQKIKYNTYMSMKTSDSYERIEYNEVLDLSLMFLSALET